MTKALNSILIFYFNSQLSSDTMVDPIRSPPPSLQRQYSAVASEDDYMIDINNNNNNIALSDEETSSLVENNNNNTSFRQPTNISRTNSSLDDAWEDDEEAYNNLSRYHMEYIAPSSIPMPAEFSHFSLRTNYRVQLQQSIAQLRRSARQRHAARLLSMPNDHFLTRLRVSLIGVCCDATDVGIVLLLSLVCVWLLLGWLLPVRGMYWIMGIGVLMVRVSARRLYSMDCRPPTKRRTATSSSAVSLPSQDDESGSWKPSLSDHGGTNSAVI